MVVSHPGALGVVLTRRADQCLLLELSKTTSEDCSSKRRVCTCAWICPHACAMPPPPPPGWENMQFIKLHVVVIYVVVLSKLEILMRISSYIPSHSPTGGSLEIHCSELRVHAVSCKPGKAYVASFKVMMSRRRVYE